VRWTEKGVGGLFGRIDEMEGVRLQLELGKFNGARSSRNGVWVFVQTLNREDACI
jgi:hypothetical protein